MNSVLKYGSMTLTVEIVTPVIAKEWLQQNHQNRRLREVAVAQYAKDMQDGNWERKPVAVCFDEMGNLGNGQHTLNGIVESGTSQELLVARNVPRQAIAMMDRGLNRTLTDVAKFLGAEIDGRRASIARVMNWGPKTTTGQSFNALLEAYQEHADVIDFVCEAGPRVAGVNAVVLAVCAKALYTQDREKIRRFIHVLHTGMTAGGHESAAIRLRDFSRSQRGSNATAFRDELYNKTMSALAHFLEGKGMSKLYGTSVDLFPVTALMEAA